MEETNIKLISQTDLDMIERNGLHLYYFNAVYHNAKRGTSTRFDKMTQGIIERTLKEPYNVNLSCSHCVLKLYKDCGKLYFQTKDYLEQKQIQEMTEEQEEQFKEEIKKELSKRNKTINKTKSKKQ